MKRTTLGRDVLELLQKGQGDKEQILQDLEHQGGRRTDELRQGAPAAVVRFETFAPATMQKVRDFVAGGDLARGTQALHGQPVIEPDYLVIADVPLFKLDDPDRVDVIRFGRIPSQDVALPDPFVSREHGLVIFADKVPLYCDYGTLSEEGKHSGSLNGTYVDGGGPIRNTMLTWLPNAVLTLGSLCRSPTRELLGTTRITYTLTALTPGN